MKHAIRPLEGQETSMPTEEPYRATDDDGRITASRGEYEEEDAWHDAREDWWEEVAYEEAKTGGHEDKAREGSSTPAVETPTVGASADVRPRVADGGGEGTKATTDEGAERGIQEVEENEGVCALKNEHDITKDACGRAGQEGREGVPRGENGNIGGCGGHQSKEHRHGVRGRKVPFRKGTRRGAEYETCNTAA